MNYTKLSREQLLIQKALLQGIYNDYKVKGLKLDISRGKPAPEMLSLSNPILSVLGPDSNLQSEDGMDARNYGGLDGIPEAKRLFSEILSVPAENLIVYGNSSLNLMYDTLARAMIFGVFAGGVPLYECQNRKWLCPVPGYDRHFAITDKFGFEMINIPMHEDGPDMDLVEQLVSDDPDIKGIWCVPVYSNPTGTVYSHKVIERLAALKPASRDFRIYCDNAYVMHTFAGATKVKATNLLTEAQKRGSGSMVYIFTSTSKVSFAGGGVSAIASGEENLAFYKKLLSYQTIGHDKLNQLRHARYFKDVNGVAAHMEKYMTLLVPKFETVCAKLKEGLSATGVAEWTEPKGGFFISVDLLPGCAKRTVTLCKDAGLILTPAGATFPYGMDPNDSNIRISPSFPHIEQLAEAMDVFCASVKLAAVEKLLQQEK
ncbi:MAG TPA: aminotransferase class I/II-fold pyridoxal phosphate-dependent enzyme [Oscillospiraceae bacterium]|mgnify:FL=1|nr:aminotransferase class I/II-fold pyridoxal phosphate-dependent enzyme [Oscillospiraceae bacterium]HPF55611.1 aminotransferase class I/II-fold pyridoxal phosphate-dependent enzyme [Clostridiales bacterium]HPK34624.1 aminotransferase class I/II-fold pyridoxal phosphate-dependent enzyme [Oscillospiraceae bacterium]HPR74611.1 aminotransferase class I/II-fold pyridoxal phosphate-dependent enzyme [Oscillospiraceae bacterium]